MVNMVATQLVILSSLVSLLAAQETVLGVYIFHRHGDRTSKNFPPASLTDLGYSQVYQSGNFYRDRYVDANSTSPIFGIAHNVVKTTQLNVQAPSDAVLQNSAAGFLQGLYPPVGGVLGSQVLANGTNVTAPNGGFQLIPVNPPASVASTAGSNEESSAWLQGSSGCNNAIVSSNSYFSTPQYMQTLNATMSFYQGLLPVINGTFNQATDTFKNAYTIFDLVHVSEIHNKTIPSSDLLTPEALFQLQTLADNHEFNLAYNASEPIRAIAGSTLAAQIVQQLNSTIMGKSKQPVGVQFGAYGSFMSFFGQAGLVNYSSNFTGIVDYASSMAFELVTNATVTNTSYPTNDQISVRFLFSNGTAASNPLTAYPLFNQNTLALPWTTFVEQMNTFAIGTQAAWCNACGNSTGVCGSAASGAASSSAGGDSSSSGGISRAVAGVIGAMVTLAVILGAEVLIMLLGGLRLVSKKRLGTGGVSPVTSQVHAKA